MGLRDRAASDGFANPQQHLRYTVSGNGCIQCINRLACRVLGYQQEELVGLEAQSLFRPNEAVDEELRTLFLELRQHPGETRTVNGYLMTKEDRRVEVRASARWDTGAAGWVIDALVLNPMPTPAHSSDWDASWIRTIPWTVAVLDRWRIRPSRFVVVHPQPDPEQLPLPGFPAIRLLQGAAQGQATTYGEIEAATYTNLEQATYEDIETKAPADPPQDQLPGMPPGPPAPPPPHIGRPKGATEISQEGWFTEYRKVVGTYDKRKLPAPLRKVHIWANSDMLSEYKVQTYYARWGRPLDCPGIGE
jgi:PAS domain S-box-containing protein